MRVLDVWLYGRAIGRIVETRRGARFEYTPEIIESYLGRPLLSLALPVKHKPFRESKTRNWFEGLLPEGERKDQLCQKLGLNRNDWIGLLAEIGWECAGAVQVFPEGAALSRDAAYLPLSQDELVNKLAHSSASQIEFDAAEFRMSLGGYQEKLCVTMPPLAQKKGYMNACDVALPQGDAPSTHILKPEPANYPGLAESEAWAMTAAGYAARCSKVALLTIDGAPQTLIIERYDRTGEVPGMVKRLHQEDACQALGLPIEHKYASEVEHKGDNPTYKGIANLLCKYGTKPKEELKELLRQLIVNLALGNWDAHAKNTSLLYTKSMNPEVAPLYDVVPIAEVEPKTTLLSMRVNGALDPNKIDGESVMLEAMSWGLDEATSQHAIDSTLEALKAGLAAASIKYPAAAIRHEKNARERIEKLKR